MEYMVIEEANRDDLVEMVNEYIKQGWQPTGGVCQVIEPVSFRSWYTQAIIRNDFDKAQAELVQACAETTKEASNVSQG